MKQGKSLTEVLDKRYKVCTCGAHISYNNSSIGKNNKYKYYLCNCGELLQVNPYEQGIPEELIDFSIPSNIKPLSSPISNEQIEISNLRLVDIKKDSILNQLPHLQDIYDIADIVSVQDVIHANGMFNYEYDERHKYFLYSIYYKDIYMGIIGIEVYKEFKDMIWLGWTNILPEFQGHGIGSIMLSIMENEARDLGYKELYIDSVTNPSTLKFYTSKGYENLGTCREFRKNNKDRPFYKMLYYINNFVFRKKL